MPGADRLEDLRCSCGKKFAEVSDTGIVIGCRGCGEPISLPFAVLVGKASVLEHLRKLPPRKQRLGSRRKTRPQK